MALFRAPLPGAAQPVVAARQEFGEHVHGPARFLPTLRVRSQTPPRFKSVTRPCGNAEGSPFVTPRRAKGHAEARAASLASLTPMKAVKVVKPGPAEAPPLPMLLGGEDACKLAVQPSKAKVPETTTNDEYVAALKREFHAALARTLDKASEEKAELQQELASAATASQEHLQKLVDTQAAEMSELKEAVMRLEAAARCWEADKAELQKELAIAAAASQEYLQKLVLNQAELTELKEAVMRLEARHLDKTDAKESCWAAEKAEMQGDLARAAAAAQEYLKELAGNQAEIAELKEAVLRLQAGFQDKTAQESCWAAEKAQLQQDLASAAAASQECSQELARNEVKVAELQEAVASLQAYVKEQDVALLSMHYELYEFKAQVHETAKKEELWDISGSSQCSPFSARASSSRDAVLPGPVQEVAQQTASSRRAPVITRWQDAGLWGRTKASLQDGRLGQASQGVERKDGVAKDILRQYVERYGKNPERPDQLTKFAQNIEQRLPFTWARDVLAAA
ncbi:unnamed protein product [Symbiodinium natans]|uniref:Uncharacterized protein n=1 Tax=Symbiodinium natans TaxID=878477 RepID=A0A812UYN6_9DINO|nr:unnamed protein product [Symbiodinium natans]